MSLQSTYIDSQPLCTILRQSEQGAVDDAGLPLNALVAVGNVAGRISSPSARQVEAWRSLGIEANYNFYTFYQGFRNGDFLESGDGRLFRVMATRNPWYQMGNLQTFSSIPLLETSRGALGL